MRNVIIKIFFALLLFPTITERSKGASLKNLVQNFEAESLLISAIKTKVRASKMDWKDGVSQFLPQLGLTITKPWNDQEKNPLQPHYDPEGLQGSLTLKESLYQNHAQIYNLASSHLKWKMTIEQGKEEINQLIFQLISSYYDFLLARSQKQISEQEIENRQQTLKRAFELNRIGKMSELNYLQAQIDLEKARLQQERMNHQLDLALLSLKRFMPNFEPSPELSILNLKKTPYFVTLFMQQSQEHLLATGLENAPSNKIAILQLDLQKEKYYQSWRSFLPGVYLQGGYNWDFSSWMQDQKEDQVEENWNISLNLNWDLFDGFQKYRQMERSKMEMARQRWNNEDKGRVYQGEVKKAMLSVAHEKTRLKMVEQLLSQATKRRTLASLQYKLGLISSEDLNQAELDLNKAETERVQRTVDYFKAIATVLLKVGIPLTSTGQWIMQSH